MTEKSGSIRIKALLKGIGIRPERPIGIEKMNGGQGVPLPRRGT